MAVLLRRERSAGRLRDGCDWDCARDDDDVGRQLPAADRVGLARWVDWFTIGSSCAKNGRGAASLFLWDEVAPRRV